MANNIRNVFIHENDVPLEYKVALEQKLLEEVDKAEQTLLVPVLIESRHFYRDPNSHEGYSLLTVCSYKQDGQRVTSDVEIVFGEKGN